MRLSERIVGELPKRVRVVEGQKYAGIEGTVGLVYYDRLHTGNSYDLLEVRLDDGGHIRGPANLFEAIDDEPSPRVADRRFVNTTFGAHPRRSR